MATTTKHGFPMPAADGSDPPAGHTQIRALANALDDELAVRSKGKSIILADQSIGSSQTNVLLGTPDRVQNIVLPTDGLIAVMFDAMWKKTAGTLGTHWVQASVHLSGTQVKQKTGLADGTGSQAAVQMSDTTNNYWRRLWSHPGGLMTADVTSTSDTTDLETGGQVLGGENKQLSRGFTTGDWVLNYNTGGPMYIWASAGTYDVEVRFSTSTVATAQVKNRRLFVWSMEF